jgi:hypothetical protein
MGKSACHVGILNKVRPAPGLIEHFDLKKGIARLRKVGPEKMRGGLGERHPASLI